MRCARRYGTLRGKATQPYTCVWHGWGTRLSLRKPHKQSGRRGRDPRLGCQFVVASASKVVRSVRSIADRSEKSHVDKSMAERKEGPLTAKQVEIRHTGGEEHQRSEPRRVASQEQVCQLAHLHGST
eukprot:scaffold25716_cov33-Tisochrysis_lutea.AAC.2